MPPKPIFKTCVCSECGLPWEDHTTKGRKTEPTLDDCVRLLKAALAAKPMYSYPTVSGSSANSGITFLPPQ